MADNNLPEFLQGYDDLDSMDIDFGIEAVSADDLGEKTVEGQRATEILESNVEGISQVEQKLDDVYGTLVALKSLLDFDELNIEGKLDKILTAVKDVPAPVAATNIEGTVVAEESAETREKLDKIVAALGDPEKRKADVERRLQEAIENHKETISTRLRDVEKLILPLLINLIKPDALQKKYIYWPNRKEIIERQIKKIMAITREG
jgi:uncharacterized protein YoxC